MSDPVPIIADASPLIGLASIGHLDLLWELYQEVVIPVQVLEELHVRENRPGSRALLHALEAEKRGRTVAKRRNVPVAGTGTILLAAKKEGSLRVPPRRWTSLRRLAIVSPQG